MNASGIIFTLVASSKDGNIIADVSRVKGGAVGVNAKKVFNSLPKGLAEKRSYNYDGSCYNIIYEGNICFMAVTDDGFNRVQCFSFLEDVKKKYRSYGTDRDRLSMELKKSMEFFSDPGNDKFEKVKRDIDQAKQHMLENVDKMIERGERIDTVVGKTESLNTRSMKFERQATTLKNTMWKKKMVMCCVISLVIVLIVAVALLFLCSEGGVNLKKCIGGKSHPKSNPSPSPSSGSGSGSGNNNNGGGSGSKGGGSNNNGGGSGSGNNNGGGGSKSGNNGGSGSNNGPATTTAAPFTWEQGVLKL